MRYVVRRAATEIGRVRGTRRTSDGGERHGYTPKPFQPLPLTSAPRRKTRPPGVTDPPACVDCGSTGEGVGEVWCVHTARRTAGRCADCHEDFELQARPSYVESVEAAMDLARRAYDALFRPAPGSAAALDRPRWSDLKRADPLTPLIEAWDRRDGGSLTSEFVRPDTPADESETEAA